MFAITSTPSLGIAPRSRRRVSRHCCHRRRSGTYGHGRRSRPSRLGLFGGEHGRTPRTRLGGSRPRGIHSSPHPQRGSLEPDLKAKPLLYLGGLAEAQGVWPLSWLSTGSDSMPKSTTRGKANVKNGRGRTGLRVVKYDRIRRRSLMMTRHEEEEEGEEGIREQSIPPTAQMFYSAASRWSKTSSSPAQSQSHGVAAATQPQSIALAYA